MPDREKVIKAFEYLNWYFTQDDGTADKNAVKAWEVLLREQEPVEPKEIVNKHYPIGDYRRTIGWLCGNCGETLMGDADYCSYCGRKVKWDE